MTTWSLSQRMPRLTCKSTSGTNIKAELSLSAMVSVGWKWPASSVNSLPERTA